MNGTVAEEENALVGKEHSPLGLEERMRLCICRIGAAARREVNGYLKMKTVIFHVPLFGLFIDFVFILEICYQRSDG